MTSVPWLYPPHRLTTSTPPSARTTVSFATSVAMNAPSPPPASETDPSPCACSTPCPEDASRYSGSTSRGKPHTCSFLDDSMSANSMSTTRRKWSGVDGASELHCLRTGAVDTPVPQSRDWDTEVLRELLDRQQSVEPVGWSQRDAVCCLHAGQVREPYRRPHLSTRVRLTPRLADPQSPQDGLWRVDSSCIESRRPLQRAEPLTHA